MKWTRTKGTATEVARYTSGPWTIQNMGTVERQSCRWILLRDGAIVETRNGPFGGLEHVTGTLRKMKDEAETPFDEWPKVP